MDTKITAILVDDESNSRIVLKSLLDNFAKEIEVIGEADNVADAFELIKSKNPQLVFLDIQMPKANGFALLKKYETLPFEVVFVTSFDQYAINAIKFSALDYLLKPVEVSDLRTTVVKAVKRIEEKNNNRVQIINLLHNINTTTNEHKVAVHVGEIVKFIEEKDIVYIEAEGSYSDVFVTTGERYTTARNLKDYEEYFGEESSFVRVHRSCLINTKHIKTYSKGEPFIIELVNEKAFEVPRRKKAEVLDKLKAK
jgi:two-component system LytT family response regulator